MNRFFFCAAVLFGGGTAMAQGFLPSNGPSGATAPQQMPFRPQAAPAPTAPMMENLNQFDPVHVQVTWKDGNWQLVADGAVIKDFGRDAADARKAMELIQALRLNQHGKIGDHNTVMEYWLTDGHAPVGLTAGLRRLAIDTGSLKAEQNQGQWVVRDRQRVWFTFGPRGDEAQQALAVMKKYGFNQVASVGAPTPMMTVFLGNPILARPGFDSGATRFQAPTAPPPDAVAALGGVVAPALPPLRNVSRQPNQPLQPFARSQAQETMGLQTAAFRSSPPAAALNVTERVTFDYRQAQVRQEAGHWKLATGTYVIKDFGPNVQAARDALRAVQYYHVTEQDMVGQPTPYCSYFLANGQAPRGIVIGAATVPIQPQQLTVQKIGDRYVVASGDRPLLRFGDRPDEANQMLEVMRRHRFDHIVYVGGPEEEGLTFLVRANDQAAPGTMQMLPRNGQ